MTITASLTASPASLSPGSVLTVTYAVQGANPPSTGQVISFSGTVTVGGTSHPGSTGSFTLPAAASAAVAASVSYGMPACAGLVFAKTSNPAAFTAAIPAAARAGKVTVSGSVIVGTARPVAVSVSVTIGPAPVAPPVEPPPASGTVPYPLALATGHVLLEQFLPDDLYEWRYQPGTTTPVVNGSGVSEDPGSPRNVSVTTDGDLLVLQLATTSTEDCGVIQSPGQYPTSSGVIETLIRFSGFTSGGSDVFADWASFWMYNTASWPGGGEIDAVETSYGNSYVSYHYTSTTSASSDTATTGPWTYTGKTIQLSPDNTTTAPVAPNIIPNEWTYVTLAFGRNAGGYLCDVYYNGTLYCTINGPYVTGGPMCVTAGTGFGATTLGANQAPYDQPGTVELQYVRTFS
jgi:hypothetical protein